MRRLGRDVLRLKNEQKIKSHPFYAMVAELLSRCRVLGPDVSGGAVPSVDLGVDSCGASMRVD
jgi:hypothetical protein